MEDQEFNLYMRKFKNRYFIKADSDNVRIIESRLGKIAPYAPEKRLLGIWCINLSGNKKKSILKRLTNILIEVHQDCEREFGAYFHEKDLDTVCKVIKAKRKRQLASEQKQILIARAKINFKAGRMQ